MDRDAWAAAFCSFLRDPGAWSRLTGWARARRCLPIHASWTHAYGVSADGQVWVTLREGWTGDTDEERAFPGLAAGRAALVPEGRWRTTALVQGASEHPWLAALLPQRPAEAALCEVCGGRPLPSPMICSCGGVGWVVP